MRFPEHSPLASQTGSPAPNSSHWLRHCCCVRLKQTAMFWQRDTLFKKITWQIILGTLIWNTRQYFNNKTIPLFNYNICNHFCTTSISKQVFWPLVSQEGSPAPNTCHWLSHCCRYTQNTNVFNSAKPFSRKNCSFRILIWDMRPNVNSLTSYTA